MSYVVSYNKLGTTEFNTLTASDLQFHKALRYLQVSDNDIQVAITKINAAGLGSKVGQQILSLVMHHEHPAAFFKAIQSPMLIEDFLASQNILDTVTQRYKLNPQLVIDLFQHASSSQPATGKGEAFMCLFVRNAKKSKTGDIEIDGKKFEVKGFGARLVGFLGGGSYGSQTVAAERFKVGLDNLITHAEMHIDLTDLNYNMTPRSNGVINDIAPILTSRYWITKKDIARIYKLGMREVYRRACDYELRWLEQSLNDDGLMNEKFFLNYFTFAVQYYSKVENFDHLVVFGTNQSPKALFGKMGHLSKQDIVDKNNITYKILPEGWPSFLASAGSQGAFFAIRPAL